MKCYFVNIDQLYPRCQPYYESPFYPFPLKLGECIYKSGLIRKATDFNYIESNIKNQKVYLPLEYLSLQPIENYRNFEKSLTRNLTPINPAFSIYNPIYIKKTIYPDLINLLNAAQTDNIDLKVIKGFISYELLTKTYQDSYEMDFMQSNPEKPGESIYHSGEVLDFTSSEINNITHSSFGLTKAYKWLLNHGSRYNFYPAYSENSFDSSIWKPYQFRYSSNVKNKPKKLRFLNVKHINKTLIYKKKYKFGAKVKYLFIHDSEHSARKLCYKFYSKYGGEFIQIINNGKRNLIYPYKNMEISIDPNRIFTQKGIIKDLLNQNPNIPGEYLIDITNDLLKMAYKWLRSLKLKSSEYLIALHTNNRSSDLDIDFFKKEQHINSFKINKNPKHHPKNFFYTINKKDFCYFKAQNFNVVLQLENNIIDDGSLSIFMQRRSAKYISIEVQEGFFGFQEKMLKSTLFWIRKNNFISLP